MANKKGIHLDPFNGVFGLPPKSHVSDDAIINSMPVLQIAPGVPNFTSGLTLFRVDTKQGWTKYTEILARHGFSLSTSTLNLAFIADNFPTDSFTNEYGETFLQKFTDVASQGMQQLAQITGSSTGTQALTTLGTSFEKMFEGIEGPVGSMLQGGATGMINIGQGLNTLKQKAAGQGAMLGGALSTIDKMLAGHRVDFPNIWRNSAFTPSYTATIRLYNPKPGSSAYTKRYIIGPIAAILCLAIPQSDDGKTFQWPFFLKVRSAGIYRLDPAVITNVTIVKGGDQQQIGYTQRLGMVDVRIDFASLYNSIVVETHTNFEADRPTLRNYLAAMDDTNSALIRTRKQMRTSAAAAAGASQGPNIVLSSAQPNAANPATENVTDLAFAKGQAARRRLSPTVAEKEVTDRVSEIHADTQKELIAAAQGAGFYPTSSV